MLKTILDANGIREAIDSIVHRITSRPGDGPFAVVGVRRGGEHLAHRLAAALEAHQGTAPPLGMVDITLYRDDGFGPREWPEVGVTHIPFRLRDYTVVLVDDVLYTGRTVRAALDAILDYGRPKAVRLAVMVDRGLRELPIAADAAGIVMETRPQQHVRAHIAESPAPEDRVVLEEEAKK